MVAMESNVRCVAGGRRFRLFRLTRKLRLGRDRKPIIHQKRLPTAMALRKRRCVFGSNRVGFAGPPAVGVANGPERK